MDRIPHTSDPFLLKRRFDDLDDLIETARGWDLDFRQLDRGSFRGEVEQAGAEGLLICRARFGRALEQKGSPPPGRTFGIPADARQRFQWRGRDVTGNNLLVFPPGEELDSISRPGFHVYTLSLPDETLEGAAGSLGLPLPEELPGGVEVARCAPRDMDRLRRSVARMLDGLLEAPQETKARVGGDLGCDLATELLTALVSVRRDLFSRPGTSRDQALRRALEHIGRREGEPLTVGELSRATGVSERTLLQIFRERFGISTKEYLRAVRLNGARRDLRRAGAADTRVSDVANRWGFWHMGQFAADYRRQFGELPSRTLERTPSPLPDRPAG